MSSWINFDALWQIVVIGLLAGAGLPALFAVGLAALSTPGSRVRTASASAAGDGITESDHVYGGNPAGLAIAILCFAVVLAAVGTGIYFIVAGS